jgi:hypothetical protein
VRCKRKISIEATVDGVDQFELGGILHQSVQVESIWEFAIMKPVRFINETIEVVFDKPPALEKKPGPPSAFLWRGEKFAITELISEWHDYQRRGRMSRNMQPKHAKIAERGGSWGVGQDYFRVRTDKGRLFDLYFDRAPVDVDRRKGAWFLDRELTEGE